ncbi:hypothetical protein GCM10009801_38710 [Streptomyces albiaxialis]|uniref:Uncharacterized protein n=1 Tax=Streptomyces albiaxialis TaxID=329523 RepID=A0ABN2W244_9ACTN
MKGESDRKERAGVRHWGRGKRKRRRTEERSNVRTRRKASETAREKEAVRQGRTAVARQQRLLAADYWSGDSGSATGRPVASVGSLRGWTWA